MLKGAVSSQNRQAVWSHLQKRFSHKVGERFRHSGLVTLYGLFGYMLTVNLDSKKQQVALVFNNILFHYTPQPDNNGG